MSEALLNGNSRSSPTPPQRPPHRPPHNARARAGARALRALAYLLIVLGALALIDAGVTLVWQEPLTALYATLRQDALGGELHALEHARPTVLEQRALASLPDERRRVAYLARRLEHDTPDGNPVGRIWIPEIDADYIVVKGTGTSELESGPGVYSETAFPGVPGTTAIAGHRTTWLAPFRKINLLKPGNHIILEMPYARFTYTVVGQRVVLPTDVSAAISQLGYTRLVLSACTPLFSASHRLLVYARLTRALPVGAARALPGHPLIQPIVTPLPGARAHGHWVGGHWVGGHSLPAVLEPLEPHRPAALI